MKVQSACLLMVLGGCGIVLSQTMDVHTTGGIQNFQLADIDSITFNLSTGDTAWANNTQLPAVRRDHAAAAYGGNIYIVGGAVGSGAVNTVWEYDPVQDTYTSKANLPANRRGLRLAVVGSYIYAIGGSPDPVASTNVYRYDPAADTWTQVASMATARSNFACAVHNGRIYVFGGDNNGWYTNAFRAEVYDPAADTWTAVADLPSPSNRGGFNAASYGGKIYIAGGIAGTGATGGTVTDQLLIYDPSTDSYSSGASLATATYNASVVVVGDRIYTIGGSVTGSSVLAYDVLANNWASAPSLQLARYSTAAAVANGRIFVFGGEVATGASDAVESLSP